MATAQVRADDRVLDVGCGIGRIALPLSRLLDARGAYDGFDTSPEYVDWARRELGLDSRFRFQTFSLRSSHYNAAGYVRPEEFAFPWPESSFTLAFAVSIFTHLSAAAARNYLAEIARTLQPAGRLFATFYVLDEESMPIVAERKTDPPFSVTTHEGMIGDAADPEAAVAFRAQWVADAIASAGLTFDAFYPGRWRHLPVIAHQDIVVARKER